MNSAFSTLKSLAVSKKWQKSILSLTDAEWLENCNTSLNQTNDNFENESFF